MPDSEGATTRWSVDHLFLDQDAIPTFVEVKRSNDSRIRREVVGQMLDYAANAVGYWPAEAIRAQFEERCARNEEDPAQVIGSNLGLDIDVEQFWQQVKTNLEAGKVRMLFVADEIPTELQRVVEFLNDQMNPAEVLAIQVKQYVGEGHKTLVAHVVGQTARAAMTKGRTQAQKRKWDEASFFADLTTRCGTSDVKAAQQILKWVQSTGLRVWWGEGAKWGSFFPMFDYGNDIYWTVSVWTYGTVEIQFQMMKAGKPPFDNEAKRAELRERLNALPGISIPYDGLNRRPSIRLSALKEETILNQFLGVLEWMISEIKRRDEPEAMTNER